MIPTLKKKKKGGQQKETLRGEDTDTKGKKGGVVQHCGKVKDETRGKERVVRAMSLIEIFSSILSGRAGVSVLPNGVIKGINLRQELICGTHHGIFIRYHHSVMNLLITSDKHYTDQPAT